MSNPGEIALFSVGENLLRNYLIDHELNPILANAEKSYLNDIDFSQNLIEIEKVLVTSNKLPCSRYGETKDSKLVLVTTQLQNQIDDFLTKVYDPNSTKPNYWITGPSGIGKSFSILINVLKTRRFNSKDLILQHIILSEVYIFDFDKCFFNDLVYAFAPFLEDNTFPKCPYLTLKTETPLKDWMLYILLSLNTTCNNIESFTNFLVVAKIYCKLTNKQFIIFVDQTNIFQRYKKANKIIENVSNFMMELLCVQLSNKVIYSSSNNNEDFDCELKAIDLQNSILKANVEGCFTKDQIKQIVKKKCNLECDDQQLEQVMERTGSIPLEIWEFCKIPKSVFDEKLKEYIIQRTDMIEKEVSQFYMRKVQIMGWEKNFLEKFFVILDTKSKIQEEDYESTIDRKYMFVKDDKLWSVSPIAHQVLFDFYSEKLLQKDEEVNSER